MGLDIKNLACANSCCTALSHADDEADGHTCDCICSQYHQDAAALHFKFPGEDLIPVPDQLLTMQLLTMHYANMLSEALHSNYFWRRSALRMLE